MIILDLLNTRYKIIIINMRKASLIHYHLSYSSHGANRNNTMVTMLATLAPESLVPYTMISAGLL